MSSAKTKLNPEYLQKSLDLSGNKSQQEVQPLMFKVKSEQVGLNKYIQSLDQSILKTSESIKTKVSDIAIADRNRLERKKRQIGEL